MNDKYIPWVAVEHSVPGDERFVLVAIGESQMEIAHRDNAKNAWIGTNGEEVKRVSHWMKKPTHPHAQKVNFK